ncbi:MAG: DUF6088 family protein [Chitinispirillales bacterium]|jgi:hypothetical protein|nr:DUF6088 family protein [Chitinispirillales bacterium]
MALFLYKGNFLATVADALAGDFGMDLEYAKKITNVNMNRFAEKGEIVRISKGLYGRVRNTHFGKLMPNANEIITMVLLKEDNDTIGYITGPTLLNAIGLSSWLPNERHIATNYYRRLLPKNTKIRIHKPIAPVNNENVRYLQMLDLLMAMERYPVDSEKPDTLIRMVFRKNAIENDRLILYARKLCSQRVLIKAIDIALGEIGI